MTVKRQQKNEIHAPVELVRGAIQTVLAKGGSSYRYDKSTLDKDSDCFKAVIVPSLWPLLLSTKISICTVPEKTTTKVIVETCSQWFILGDIFNYYTGYITDFLNALKQTLQTK